MNSIKAHTTHSYNVVFQLIKPLSTILFMFALCSCLNNDQDTNRFEKLIKPAAKADTIKVNPSISSNGLRDKIAKSYEVDLCDTILSFVGLIPLSESKVTRVNTMVYESCSPYIPPIGMVEIFAKSDSKIRVDMSYVSTDSVGIHVIKELESRLNGKSNLRIHFVFDWENVSQQTVIKLFKDSFTGLNRYAEKKSQEWFNQDLNDLNEEQFSKFKDKFHFSVGITSARPDFPNDHKE